MTEQTSAHEVEARRISAAALLSVSGLLGRGAKSVVDTANGMLPAKESGTLETLGGGLGAAILGGAAYVLAETAGLAADLAESVAPEPAAGTAKPDEAPVAPVED